MTEAFDPYHRWLGIAPQHRPPNHYQLLGIPLYESDPDVIESAADRQMAHVRRHQSGKHSVVSQRLLTELTAAKLCLLHDERKAAYDMQLRSIVAKRTLQQSGADGTPIDERWSVAETTVLPVQVRDGVVIEEDSDVAEHGPEPATSSTASEKSPPQSSHATPNPKAVAPPVAPVPPSIAPPPLAPPVANTPPVAKSPPVSINSGDADGPRRNSPPVFDGSSQRPAAPSVNEPDPLRDSNAVALSGLFRFTANKDRHRPDAVGSVATAPEGRRATKPIGGLLIALSLFVVLSLIGAMVLAVVVMKPRTGVVELNFGLLGRQGMSVTVDGEPAKLPADGPSQLELPPGAHRIEIAHADYQPFLAPINVAVGETSTVEVRMIPRLNLVGHWRGKVELDRDAVMQRMGQHRGNPLAREAARQYVNILEAGAIDATFHPDGRYELTMELGPFSNSGRGTWREVSRAGELLKVDFAPENASREAWDLRFNGPDIVMSDLPGEGRGLGYFRWVRTPAPSGP